MNEKHHVIPISLLGWDTVENIIVLSREDHTLIHKTLNIPYQFIREFKEKNNHKFLFDKDYYSDLRTLHCKYFSNVNKLPEHLINKQTQSLELQIEALEQKYNVTRFEKPLKQSTLLDTRLYQYHIILWGISQIISN